MLNPVNTFKQALKERQPQIGLWVGLADAVAAELLAGIGYDWLLVDAEHAPNDVRSVLAQVQAVAPYSSHPIVRPPHGDAALIKQYLDIGVQTLLVPMVEDAAQATRLVAAVRYPPRGMRGVGSALARASRWNQVEGYLQAASEQICLLVQAESTTAMENLEEIAATDGVDGVFFGPADLSASMGRLGQPAHPSVQEAICDGIRRVNAAGKAAGVLATDHSIAQRYLDAGGLFVAVGVDTSLLARSAAELLGRFHARSGTCVATTGSY